MKETYFWKSMEKPGVRENMDMLRAMRRLNSMPADMKHYVKSSVRKRCSSNAGSKEKGEFGCCKLFSAVEPRGRLLELYIACVGMSKNERTEELLEGRREKV